MKSSRYHPEAKSEDFLGYCLNCQINCGGITMKLVVDIIFMLNNIIGLSFLDKATHKGVAGIEN